MQYDFTYDNQPAHLLFEDTLGVCSEIWYLDKGVKTRRVIEEFAFNEQRLQLFVKGKVTVFYNDGETIITGPSAFDFDATSQETLDYFAEPSTPEKVKRMEVNGTAIEFLGMILFNPETGAFEPQIYTPETPVE